MTDPQAHLLSVATVFMFFVNWGIIIGLSGRVIMRRLSPGASLAWLLIISTVPFLGAFLYLFLGENRLCRKRMKRAERLLEPYLKWLASLKTSTRTDWSTFTPASERLHMQAQSCLGMPALNGNELSIYTDTLQVLDMLVVEVNRATRVIHMEFYIWHEGGKADDVAEALIHAAQRGVHCRVLVDAVGSGPFLGGSLVDRMREAGVHVAEALPVGAVQAFFARIDLRNHRKIAVFDDKVAYTGSMNMVDPRYFKQQSGVGQWVDLMVKVQGPAVQALGIVFLSDWEIETGQGVRQFEAAGDDIEARSIAGNTTVQILPSGPGHAPDAIHETLLNAVYSAKERILVTTPYFAPDETMHRALCAAARRGVDVVIIVPEKVDSKLVRYASRASFDSLMEAGVRIQLFSGGLLHSKTLVVDNEISFTGTVNMDMRSFWLNYEVTLITYSREFTSTVAGIQYHYMKRSHELDLKSWRGRSLPVRFLENVAHIFSPLL